MKNLAIVYDSLVNMGGSEKVAGIFHELFPDAPIFTTAYNFKRTYKIFENVDIKTTSIQRFSSSKTIKGGINKGTIHEDI